MKHLASIAILTLILGCAEHTIAQIQLSLTIPNLGSPYLSDYISDESNRVLIITNTTGQQQQIFLRGKLEQLNSPGYYFRTKEDFRPLFPISLAPFETRTLFVRSEDWLFLATGQLEDNVPGPEKRRFQATGILPEGEYQICIQAFDFATEQPVSPQEPAGCQFFFVSLGSPPQVLVPFCGDSIDQDYPLISWSPAIMLQAMHDIVYDLYVVELVSRVLNPEEVMEQSILYRGGNPFVVENLRQTFFQFLPGDPPLNPDSRYAICVVARSARGSAMFENQGRSEICLIDTRHAGGYAATPGTHITSTETTPEIFQVPQISQLSGRLFYRFYGDTGEPASNEFGGFASGELQLMELEPGQSLQNQGYEMNSGNVGLEPSSYEDLSAGLFNNGLFTLPPPPQYILPAGYNLSGGKFLKQARIRFTARYAVGNKIHIQHPEDLTFVGGSGNLQVTGGGLPGTLSIDGYTQVIATTTTNNVGDYNVSFFADETFGVLASGEVDVQWGSGEFVSGVSGYGLFRVITMEVEEKWYCHPDIIIFLQPGQSLEVPPQVVTVQSYNLKMHVRAIDDDKIHFAGSGQPIPGAVAKVGRKKTYHDQAPACFPKDEVKIDQFGDAMIGLHKAYMAADTGFTDAEGNITFTRLVKHDGIGNCIENYEGAYPSDGYYLEAVTHPTQGQFNYSKDWDTQFAPCEVRLAAFCPGNECAPRSATYVPPFIDAEMVLGPKWPLIRAYSQADYGEEAVFLPDVNLLLSIWMGDGDFKWKSYQTDMYGHFIKQMTAPGDIGELFSWNPTSGALTSQYRMEYFKAGFKAQQCNECGTAQNKKTLQMGQVWPIDIFMEPKSKVIGRVKDEHGQAVEAEVKIGDGPFLDTEMRMEIVEGVEYGSAGEPFFIPGDLQEVPQGGEQFQQVPGQIQIEQEAGGVMTQNTGPSIEIVSQGGFTIEEVDNESLLSSNFQQVSVFEHPAQSGNHLALIIQPEATNYFADTFYVNIPNDYDPPGFDLGTFVIKERLHRPRIVVKHMVLGISGDQQPQLQEAPIEGAEVLLSNFPEKTTQANGSVQYVFGSPSNEFRLRIYKQGYVPYDQQVVIPVSKDPYTIEIILENGKSLSGTITRAIGGQPIAGARVYTEIGSNNYGPIVLETFSDNDGSYELEGLPSETLTIEVTKSDPSITYIGQSKPANMALITTLNFQLQAAPFLLSDIWNLPVVVESVTPSGNNWIVSGAFVDLPNNQRFQPEDETQRLGFNNITVKVSGPPPVPGGKPPVEPVANSILTNTLKFRSVLNDAHVVEMSGPKAATGGLVYIYNQQYLPVSINRIRVDKGSGNGHVKARVFSLLEYFRISYNYNGQFYLGETPDNVVMSAYKGVEDLTMPDKYFLMGYNYSSDQAINPTFSVHNFSAFTEREESYVHQDSFVLAAKLIVKLPLSNPDELIVSTGDVVVLPNKIIVNEGDEPLEFDLETWHVKTGGWEFKPSKGGIVTSGTITTNLIQFYAPNILIKPTSLKLPSGNEINLSQITLAGILDLDMQPGAKLGFDYVESPAHSPGQGHWRVSLYNPQDNQPVAKVEGLPGWSAQTSVDIRYIENFSDGYEQLTLAPNQTVNHYNVIQQTVSNIYFYEGGVAMVGNTNLGIPKLTSGASASFIYYLEQNTLKVRVQGLYTLFESTGQVEFQGDQQHERIFLDWNHFEVTGGITIYDDLSANEIHLRGKLIKKPNDIRIKIILVDPGGQLEGNIEQVIALGGGQNGSMHVLQGEQLVSQLEWQHLVYKARFEGFGGSMKPGHDVMWFKVNGSVINDPTKNDELELSNIETPFGDFALKLDFEDMAIVGDLRVANIPMGAVTIIEGVINMRMGGLGFYLVSHLRALYPLIAELNTNFIVGHYPNVTPDAQQVLKTGMYIETLPAFLAQSGIQGLYICANKPIIEFDWEVDLLIFSIGVYANAGIDARFWLNFGEDYGAAHLGGLLYADFEIYASVLGICEMCLGVLAELGFEAEYEWEPDTDFEISVCGTVGFNVSFCDEGFNETAKLEIGWSSSSSDIFIDAELGESCSGNADSGPGGCKHF